MNTRTAVMLDRIPMLNGLVAVTLYELPKIRKSEIHGGTECYKAGCRCDQCRLANADRQREWKHRVGRSIRAYPAADARRSKIRADNNYSVNLDQDSE